MHKDLFTEEINETIKCLRKGGVILYPTDTVWGIGCDATNPDAIRRISELKQRAGNKSYILLLDDASKLNKYVKEVPNVAWDLVEYATRPLTIIYPDVLNVDRAVIADDGSAGIRITSDPFCRELIRKFNKPVVSTSANIGGEPAPAAYADISNDILSGVDYVVNLRKDEKEPVAPSTIIKLDVDGTFSFIRK